MKNTQIYLLTLNSPSQNALRLWTGRSLHTLRHCSVKQIGSALVEMQKNVDALQESMGMLKQVKKQLASVSEAGMRETTGKHTGAVKQVTPFVGHDNRRTSKKVQQVTIGRRQRQGGFFRNVGQKGGSQ